MSTTVFFAVILAALLHAGWNAVVKSGLDKRAAMGAVVLGHLPFALVLVPLVPFPRIESLPYILAGIVLHVGYQLSLMRSYQLGDLTQVYPIARGVAPLIVALLSVTLLGLHLSALALVAIAVISTGILSLGLVRRADGQRNAPAAFFALTTGCFIAGYSLVDGLGARVAGTALGFLAWLTIGNALFMVLYFRTVTPGVLGVIITKGRRTMLLGGGASFLAYGIVMWAFTQAPIALVTALRETSIIFALIIGVAVLKEPLNLLKVLATMLTLTGAFLLRFAR